VFTPDLPAGLRLAGSTKLAAAATTTSVLTIDPFDMLWITYSVTGYGAADIAAFRFGGTGGAVDSAANYWDRHMQSAAGGTTFTNTQTASSTMIRVAAATATTGRVGSITVQNFATIAKIASFSNSPITQTANAATVGVVQLGGGQWTNTTQQIVSVQMVTAGGQTLSAGTGFAVWGLNF
jgi:hypothetical protein